MRYVINIGADVGQQDLDLADYLVGQLVEQLRSLTRLDVDGGRDEFQWVVDDEHDGELTLLGAFPTEDAGAQFIGTLPDYESGRYGLLGPLA